MNAAANLTLVFEMVTLQTQISIPPEPMFQRHGIKWPEPWLTLWLSWWRYQMDGFFSTLLALCKGNPRKASDTNFDVFFDVHLNKRLTKQSRCRWFETPWRSWWHHCNDLIPIVLVAYPRSLLNRGNCFGQVLWKQAAGFYPSMWRHATETFYALLAIAWGQQAII